MAIDETKMRFSDSTRFVRYDVPEGTAHWIYEPYDYDGFPYSYPAHSLPRAGSAATGG